MQTYSGNIIDIMNRDIFPGSITVDKGKIISIQVEDKTFAQYILPGFIDSHVHIESSMLTPTEFARIAATHGTVATVSDAHEIANVLGIEGVEYMIDNGNKTPFKFYFSAPSCVPATKMETSGASLGLDEVEQLLQKDEIVYLGEMMNFPGVIHKDPEVMAKIEVARKYNKRVDGHAPGLMGEDLEKYVKAGITADHESFSLEEALEKIELGMKVQIREGSAVRNFDDLISIAHEHHDMCMFCSDDKHPDELLKGHINELVKRALNAGVDLFKVLQVACINPVLHYQLDVGLLREGDDADFIIVDNLEELNVLKTVIEGIEMAENGTPLCHFIQSEPVNKFKCKKKEIEDFEVRAQGDKVKVIEVIDRQLITKAGIHHLPVEAGLLQCDLEQDILKMAVINRYQNEAPAVAFVKNFGLKEGALASSVAHDSHNIIVVGTNDEDIRKACNLVIEEKGGIAIANKGKQVKKVLPLPIAGLISDQDYETVAKHYAEMDKMAKEMGSPLSAPFMTLSFMALLVIPELKLSDLGLFDGNTFELTELML
jgi:adenine deaminase